MNVSEGLQDIDRWMATANVKWPKGPSVSGVGSSHTLGPEMDCDRLLELRPFEAKVDVGGVLWMQHFVLIPAREFR